jgi:hypothetical protein
MINYSDFNNRKRQKILDAVECISTLQAFLNAIIDLECEETTENPNMGFVDIINNIKLELTVAQNELNFWREDIK